MHMHTSRTCACAAACATLAALGLAAPAARAQAPDVITFDAFANEPAPPGLPVQRRGGVGTPPPASQAREQAAFSRQAARI